MNSSLSRSGCWTWLLFSSGLMFQVAGFAGHGLMNAFSDPAPLPEAGLTPLNLFYAADLAAESGARALINEPEPLRDAYLNSLGERLAEAITVVIGVDGDAAHAAMDHYTATMRELSATLRSEPDDMTVGAITSLMQTLLEHQYHAASNYLDLDAEARTALLRAKVAATPLYEQLKQQLTRVQAEAFFFKEEEIRWQWEMAEQGDRQGF